MNIILWIVCGLVICMLTLTIGYRLGRATALAVEKDIDTKLRELLPKLGKDWKP